ncbi:hypothetical protein B6N60_01979 [Richelia sinica FACHB-800]|uniref:Uncharacterized protein n=1 Tax=Richelia sinica FACHB-800 TaxID=1357546 RepID=A0A975T761_9NOST|nr:hypothetical protein [Richelia sinica]MBD2664625.1 hypothetical protein [Richelia sinica FACHB-800]QXE23289.1 hypothetical protein B6N60_01979 [Richelia sinica FACHB-800]
MSIVVVTIFYSWFKRNYGKHLINLVSTVAYSLVYPPQEWIENAIAMTTQAWDKLGEDNPSLVQKEFDFYVFGHSLGGLLALSWPAFVDPQTQGKFIPQQILTADPAPSTEMGIPQIAICILKLVGSPFAKTPINICDTGSKLNVPVAIMHGADDTLVKPESWVNRSWYQKQSNFDCIASKEKQIYFSLSNKDKNPPLIAFHNQAVTDTTYFDDALFDIFGGVKKGPNAYNRQYIWPGVNLVVTNEVRADELFYKFPLKDIQVTETLPPKPNHLPKILIGILTVVGLGLVYWWFAHSGHVLSFS